MEELFGVSMNLIMWVLLPCFAIAMAGITFLAMRNRVMLKLGLRNIPRRWTQSILIIIGIMLSSVIMATAFGTGDTINFSIRNQAVEVLGPIDEIIIASRADAQDNFGAFPYFPLDRFNQLQQELADLEIIDGLTPGIAETMPSINPRTGLSEGQTRVVGVDHNSLEGFGALILTSGGEARVDILGLDEAYINDKAATELGAKAGDSIRLFRKDEMLVFRIIGIVESGGLAGDSPTLVISLERAQQVLSREGQINSIAVSNLGDTLGGADLSEEVTDTLRILFADPDIARQIKNILAQEKVIQGLEATKSNVKSSLQSDLSKLTDELIRDDLSYELISLLSDDDIKAAIYQTLKSLKAIDIQREAITLFAELGEYHVMDIKRDVLLEADQVASGVTTFFIVLGLFSIMVGILLIVLIFIMLAAARRSEMGMARAVGAKRSHLVQMFLFEGTAYAVVSAAVGVVIGFGVSVLIVIVANRSIGAFEEGFKFTPHFTARSAIVAYCLGMTITFATVAFSAYRVSRLNIVAAVRGLPSPVTISETNWKAIWSIPLTGGSQAFKLSIQGFGAMIALHPLKACLFFLRAGWAIATFPLLVIYSIWLMAWLPFKQGWFSFLLGLVITLVGTTFEEAGPYRIGVSLMIIGIGLTIRTILKRTKIHPGTNDRIAYTFMGVVNLIFWMLPFDVLRAISGELEGGPEMFFISGISMVAAAVWTVMYNSDLLLKTLTFLASPMGSMRPAIVTAVAYPMNAKFRTGLTLAMFALVIFTLIVVSILTQAFAGNSEQLHISTGGWDIESEQNVNTPTFDIHQSIENSAALHSSDFDAIGGYTYIPIQARQLDAEQQEWRAYAMRAADHGFLESTRHQFKLIAEGYGPTDQDVWKSIRSDPSLAVVDSVVIPSRGGFDDDEIAFELEGIYYEDSEMSPITIEVREPRTGSVTSFTIIGVLDVQTDNFGNMGFGMFTSKTKMDETLQLPIPITNYRFRLSEGISAAQVSQNLEASFQQYGMETEVLEEVVKRQADANRAFNNIFTGYMGMGLIVGIAALGVISLRAVVERRQQIGVLRAIGYRKRIILISFILESSFIALLGIAIGVGLGTILSYNLVNEIRDDIETLRFSIPWMQITLIVFIAYLFSLVTTFLPAYQASKIYPAEALRYE